MLSVFYDNGDAMADCPFDVEHLYYNLTEIAEDIQTVEIRVPSSSVDKLRIDFGESPGNFVISDFEVITRIKCFEFSATDIINNFSVTNDISDLNNDSLNAVNIITSGNDGYISSYGFLGNVQYHFNYNVILMYVAFLLQNLFYI